MRLILALILFVCPITLRAAEPPLAVVRVGDAAVLHAMLGSRQARAFGIDEKDFSGTLPGVGARVDSARAFLDGLAREGAKDFWYGLLQRGISILAYAGAMGWEWKTDAGDEENGGDGDILARLGRMGLGVDGLDVDVRDAGAGRERVVVSRDAGVREEFFGGDGDSDASNAGRARRGEEWRGVLADFMNGGEAGPGTGAGSEVGIWVNARPLFGALAFLSGIDIRSRLNALNMRVPEWVRIEFGRNGNGNDNDGGGDLALEIRLNNILPEGIRNSAARPVRIHKRNGAFFEVNVHAPDGFWNAFGFDAGFLSLFSFANIDIDALLPRSFAVSFREGDSGAEPATGDALLLLPDAARTDEQFERVRELYAELAAAQPSVFGIAETRSPWGNMLHEARFGKTAFAVGLATFAPLDAPGNAGGKRAGLILSRTASAWPNPGDWALTAGDAPRIAEWRGGTDPASRAALIRALGGFLRAGDKTKDKGRAVNRFFADQFLDDLLPRSVNGHIALENDLLVIRLAE